MLTPLEIENKQFKGGIGYRKKDVDNFMFNIVDSYEAVYKLNKELEEKNALLSSNLASYKTIEKQLEKSLITAQKAAEDVRNEAREEARVIEARAKIEAKNILADAKNELAQLERAIDELALAYEAYKAQIRNLAITQIEVMESTTLKFEKKTSSLAMNHVSKQIDQDYNMNFDEVAATSMNDIDETSINNIDEENSEYEPSEDEEN